MFGDVCIKGHTKFRVVLHDVLPERVLCYKNGFVTGNFWPKSCDYFHSFFVICELSVFKE